jgi:predicted short-subunit dehydrogenase-like oxidoreductase (DUF2520 family)
MNRSFTIVGPGRAGLSFAGALATIGWRPGLVLGRLDDTHRLRSAATGVDLVLLSVPDDVIAPVAASIEPGRAVVAHVSGSRTLDVLRPHERIGSVHPLMSLPEASTGTARLLDQCFFAIDGDPLMREIVDGFGGVAINVPSKDRALYHATASIASNHLAALCQQVATLADLVGVPASAYWKLMTTTLENVTEVGPSSALTGPASRGDWETIQAHLDALPAIEHSLYLALSKRAAAMNHLDWPSDPPLGTSS